MANERKKRHRIFRDRLIANVRRTPPWIVAKIALMWVLFFPWFLLTLAKSSIKASRWFKPETCRAFIRRQPLAFPGVDPESLALETHGGGISNYNQVWNCRTQDGRAVRFFVKIFVSIGSFWAENLSIVSPFPHIYGVSTAERFSVDMVSRVQLAAVGVDVPRLVAFDAVERVMVTEFIEGQGVDDMLQRMADQDTIQVEDEEMIRECGLGLGLIHRSGFSLIDTQPVNCLWDARTRKVFFTDLEFCTRRDQRSWDVGYFLCFLSIRLSEPLKRRARAVFLEAYKAERGIDWAGLEETTRTLRDYVPMFQAVLDLRQLKPEQILEELLRTG